MKSVKRYDGKIEHCDNGGYVTFADYKKLESRLENATGRERKLAARIAALTAKYEPISADYSKMKIRLAEQQAIIDQRNGECDRLINELEALRKQEPVAEIKWDGTDLSVHNVRDGFSFGVTKIYAEPAPIAVPDEMEECEAAYQDCPHGLSTAFMEGANYMRTEVLRLNSGSKGDE